RVITPGTAVDPQLVESKESVYLAAVAGRGETYGIAFLETSSGHFTATEHTGNGALQRICEELAAFAPRELLVPASLESQIIATLGSEDNDANLVEQGRGSVVERTDITLTERPEDQFDSKAGEEALKRHFAVGALSAFGLDGHSEAVGAASACLKYAQETQRAGVGHISEITYFETKDFMVLDAITLRNLDIFECHGEKSKHTLFGVIGQTVTGMGSRLLRQWVQRPSLKRSEIQTRLAAVTELSDTIFRESLRFLMKDVSDLERLIGRLNLGTATPRDVVALRRSVEQAWKVNAQLSDVKSLLLQVLSENIFELSELADLIDRAIVDEPPMNINDGGTIQSGYYAELDDLRAVSASAKQTIAALEGQERERTGIANLKIRFNNVFGYYIEISKANIARVPEDYERRQTLANAERYTTPQLKEWERKIFGADERITQIEVELFQQIRDTVCKETRKLQSTARALATLDALCALAETAAKYNYVAPELHDGDAIEIKAGRHPVVEVSLAGSFISNDVRMNNSTDRLLVITGANMGGKSTILRQIALIQILAQIGSFVPASAARLPIVDRIWTRVGASDDLASGRSTFMVEMTETAAILFGATPRSLVLLDEIGRGTSTFDGLSLAWAVAEHLHNSTEHAAKTLFATHYHELTELAETLPGAKTYQITATEKDGDVVFLHKLRPGKASKSYGIAVAKLAGLPASVIERAKAVLAKLEEYELAVFADERPTGLARVAAGHVGSQYSLFAISNESVLDELRGVEVATLSPDESKALLTKIKGRIV
nr:DNA mismatch repair protein MutS [Pyrinomonadaceae bacterium]